MKRDQGSIEGIRDGGDPRSNGTAGASEGDDAPSRRRVLELGGAALAGAALGAWVGPVPAPAMGWRKWFGQKAAEETMAQPGTVKAVKGMAFAGERPLAVGDPVHSGDVVRVSGQGQVVITLADRSIFTISGNTTLEVVLERMGEGLLRLISGTLLAAVPSGNRMVVVGPVAAIGIKGTVFFREVLEPGRVMAEGPMGPVKLPEGAKDYFCTCHGETEFMPARGQPPFLTDRGIYHSAHFLDARRPGVVHKAPMLDHSDQQIRDLVALQDGPQHDLSWLRH